MRFERSVLCNDSALGDSTCFTCDNVFNNNSVLRAMIYAFDR